MRKAIITCLMPLLALSPNARADMWGADLPLLAEIVLNTLLTLRELERQTTQWKEEMNGIKDKIERIRTIADVVQPSTWDQWRDPREAIRRLKTIYHTLPREYRSPKADAIEDELSKAMNMIARLGLESRTAFASGKELESRGADASPGVAQKLTASGVGTLISMEAQTQVIQSHITSLLAQILADANEKESRTVVSKGAAFSSVASSMGERDTRFSTHALFARRP